MSGIHVLMELGRDTRNARADEFIEDPFDHFVQGRLVLFDGQYVVAFLFDDLFGENPLSAHCVDGHDGILDIQHLQ